jgi:hypothetical protein
MEEYGANASYKLAYLFGTSDQLKLNTCASVRFSIMGSGIRNPCYLLGEMRCANISPSNWGILLGEMRCANILPSKLRILSETNQYQERFIKE